MWLNCVQQLVSLEKLSYLSARFGSTYTKIGMIQRRLAWPLHKDDTQIHQAFHIFLDSVGEGEGGMFRENSIRNMYLI